MKVAYLANYQEGTGYSIAALENILALDSVGVDQVCRPLTITGSKAEIHDKIKELEKNNLDNVDAVITHSLPSNFTYKGGVLNVGIFSYETSNFFNSGWQNHLDLMDLIIVSSKAEKAAIIETCGPHYENRVEVIPFAVNAEKYKKTYTKWDFGLPKNCIKFYTVGELVRRKNMQTTIAAYYRAFSSGDNVCLIVKASLPGKPNETEAHFKQLCDDIKKLSKKYTDPAAYPKVILINKRLTDNELNSLHDTCDIFVSTSYGEAPCLPFIDAMGFGKPVIAPQHSSFLDYVQYPWQGLLTPSTQVPCLASDDSPAGLYTCTELWGQVDAATVGGAMKYMADGFDKWNDPRKISKRKSFVDETFGYNTVGNQLKKVIEDAIAKRDN